MNLETHVFFGQLTVKSTDETLKRLSEKASEHGIRYQIASSHKIAGKLHVEWAARQALEAFDERTALTKSWEFEFLVRLSGQRQLEKAFEHFGIHKGRQHVALVAVGSKPKAIAFEKWAEKELGFKLVPFKVDQKAVQEWFKISSAELTALKDLKEPLEGAVLERVALAGMG